MSKANNENQHRKPTLKTTLKINIEKNRERRKNIDVRELKNHDDDFVDNNPFSSPEPLGLICNRSVVLDATQNTNFFIG